MHPNGQLPAYEWSFGDVNPPVHAWAALRVFEADGAQDHEFLERIFQKLLLNFTWWVNRKDAAGRNVFEGGFLGLDNIGPIDRSAALPVAGRLAQADGTAWMAMYCLNLLEIALVLAEHDRGYEDMATKFLEHFAYIADGQRGACGTTRPASTTTCCTSRAASRSRCGCARWWGCCRCAATTTLGSATLARLPDFAGRAALVHRATSPSSPAPIARTHVRDGAEGRLLSVVPPERLPRILGRAARRGRVPLAAWCAGAVGQAPRRALRDRSGRHALHDRLRTGRVDHRPVRRQLQLAGPGVVPGQPPPDRRASSASPASTATT